MFSCHHIVPIVTLTFFCKPRDLVIFLCDDIGILQLKEIEFAPSFSTLNRHLQWKHHHGNKVKRRRLSRFSEWESSFLGNFPSLNGLARRMWPWVIYSNLYLKDFCSTLGEIGISFKILILDCKQIRRFWPNLAPLILWYSKHILSHCEGSQKCIFHALYASTIPLSDHFVTEQQQTLRKNWRF